MKRLSRRENLNSCWLAGVCAALLGVCLGVPAVHAGAICGYEVAHVFRAPFCEFTENYPPIFAGGISPNGRYVCGYYPPCSFGSERAFWFDTQTGQFTHIPHPPGISRSFASAVNDSGMVVGSWDGSAGSFGFIYNINTGQHTNLTSINAGGTCSANAINNAGVVCGSRSIGSKVAPHLPFTAFTWSQATGFVDIGIIIEPGSVALAISSSGTTVGYAGLLGTSSQRGFIYDEGRLTLLPPLDGGISSSVNAINDLGMFVATGLVHEVDGPHTWAFLVDRGRWTRLLPLVPMTAAGVRDLGPTGVAVGRGIDRNFPGMRKACLWRDGEPTPLIDLVSPIPGTFFESADGISDAGDIVIKGRLNVDPIILVLRPKASLSGDSDCNNVVNIDDLVNVITHWGTCGGCSADVAADGDVNVSDLIEVIQNWSRE